MEIRLQKVLAQAGLASRRKAETLIDEGRVEVNGKKVRELGTKVDPGKDLIRVDGKLIADKERKVYFVLFKPTGVVTTLSDPQGRATIKECLEGIDERVFAVGRLDWDAEGALIITNDGELANRLMHPRYRVPRIYLAKIKGEPDQATVNKLRSGVRLEDGMAKPDRVDIESHADKNTWIRLVVSEGRPHLVKRMCAAIGHPVVRLFRPQYAGVTVEGLAPGKYRPLTDGEVEQLRRAGPATQVGEAPIRLPPRHHRVGAKPSSEPVAQKGSREANFLAEPATFQKHRSKAKFSANPVVPERHHRVGAKPSSEPVAQKGSWKAKFLAEPATFQKHRSKAKFSANPVVPERRSGAKPGGQTVAHKRHLRPRRKSY